MVLSLEKNTDEETFQGFSFFFGGGGTLAGGPYHLPGLY